MNKLSLTSHRSIPLGLRRPGSDELVLGPFSPAAGPSDTGLALGKIIVYTKIDLKYEIKKSI